MPSGFGAGFARGLAGVMKTSREQTLRKQSEEADRALRANLAILGPAIEAGIESDDYSVAERILIEINPDYEKRWKKEGSPFKLLGPILKQQYDSEQGAGRGSAAIESAPEAGAGAAAAAPGAAIVATEDQTATVNRILEMFGIPPMGDVGASTTGPGGPFGTPPFVPQDTPVTGRPRPEPSTPAGDVGEGPTLFGEPFGISSKERAKRAREAGISEEMIQFDVRRRIARQQGLDPSSKEWKDFVRFGTRPPAGQTVTPKLGTVEDFMTRKVSEKGSEPTSNDIAIWRTEWEGMNDADASPVLGGFADYVARYAGDRNVTIDDLSSEQIEDARQRYSDAGRELKGTGTDISATAELAAAQPDVLQFMTPTEAGKIVNAIASDPALKAQWEQTRMEPLRARAETAIGRIDDLLEIDATGEVVGLAPGTEQLYGAAGAFGLDAPARMMRHVPGSAAANAQAALDLVTGQLTLNILTEMKAQTRTGATGFGQLSIRELEVIESAATILKGKLSEDKALEELLRLREMFEKVMQPSSTTARRPAARTGASAEIDITLDSPVYIGSDGRPTTTAPGTP